MEASDEAALDELPGEECSARMVVRCAMQELKLITLLVWEQFS